MESKRPIVPDDLFQMKFLQGATLSPEGKQLIYALAEYDEADDADYTHLWLLDQDTGNAQQMSFGKYNNHAPAYSPDGRQIAFVSTRDTREGKPQIYLLPADGGEARPLTSLLQGVTGDPVWSPDGQMIAFTAPPMPSEDEQKPEPGDPYRVTRLVYRFDGVGYVDQAVQEIFVVSVADGEARQVTDDAAVNTSPRWSPDGRELLYNAALLPDVFDSVFPRLRIVTLEEDVRQIVTEGWGYMTGSAAWLPNGEQVAYLGVEADLPIGTKSDLYVVSAAGKGTPENRTAAYPYNLGNRLQPDLPANGVLGALSRMIITADGQTAFMHGQKGGEVQISRIALTGEESVETVLEGERSCILLGMSGDGRSLLYAVSTVHNPLELFTADIEGGNEVQLTAVNGEILSGIEQTIVKRMQFAGTDGTDVEGWMLMPESGEAPYPTVLYIHGGPHSGFGHVYSFDMQMLLGAGYGVLMVNHRASTGYGNDFATAIKGDWGNLDYGDLMAGVDEAVARGWADPDRLGVCGLSGGGNLSCWIVGQTERFKAAVPENPVTNWLSFYGTSDIGIWFSVEELGGHPHEIPEVYAKCSPITYAHRCTTPTLMVQGEADYRCPAEQSEQFYNVLKANGCPVEMVRLPKSSHGGAIMGTPKMRRAQNEALLEWMNRWVLNEPSV